MVAHATQTYYSRLAPGTLTNSTPLLIDDTTSIWVQINASVDNLITSIEGPGGEILNEATIGTYGGVYATYDGAEAGDGFLLGPVSAPGTHYAFWFPSLGAGTYTVHYEADPAITEDVAIMTQVLMDSAVRANLYATPTIAVQGGSVTLMAPVTDGASGVTGATVSVDIYDPLGNATTITLLDDGLAVDGLANDGMYSGYALTPELGTYSFLATITGVTGGGTAFSRTAASSVRVVPAHGSFATSPFTDVGVDTNGNSLYDHVQLSTDVDIVTPGTYVLLAHLMTSGGTTLRGRAQVELVAGAQAVDVTFGAADFLEANEDGPYTLTYAELLYLGTEGLEPADLINDATYTTQPYVTGDFERPAIWLLGTYSDEALDYGSDGLYDAMIVRAGIEVTTADTYIYTVRLVDRCYGEIYVLTGSKSLAARTPDELVLSFPGSEIGANGVDGPYTVTGLSIVGGGTGLVTEKLTDTQAYTASDFSNFTGMPDCNGNGNPDICDFFELRLPDCNTNMLPDTCDLAAGTSFDCNSNGIPDECETDCNGNGYHDDCDLADGTSEDCNGSGIPDECELELLSTPFDQPGTRLSGQWSDADCDDCGSSTTIAYAENFTLDQQQTIISIKFRGWYAPDNDETNVDEFSLLVHEDDAGQPGAVIYSESPIATVRTDTERYSAPYTEWAYDMTLFRPLTLPAGTYHVELYNNTTDNPNSFAWAGTLATVPPALVGSHFSVTTPGSNWFTSDADLSLTLIAYGTDCNENGVPDECDLSDGTSADVNGNLIPDDCEPDCNGNGVPDGMDIDLGTSLDCNGNDIPDECETDCNGNTIPDDCDITAGTSEDCNTNAIPDECDISSGTSLDTNSNAIPDECDPDCNSNGIPDDLDIAGGTSEDCDSNGVPDECDPDCNSNGVADGCDILAGTSIDCDSNGVPDECDPDCNGNGIADACDITSGFSVDCNINGVPDDCDLASGTSIDCNGNSIPDDCEADCNGNGIADECDLTAGTSEDCNTNSIPDECDISSGTSQDINVDGVPDECQVLGACCSTFDQTCADLTAGQCAAAEGAFMGDGSTCATVTCPFRQYSNTTKLVTYSYYNPGAGFAIADDMTFEGTGAYELAGYSIGVIGNGGGDFDATASLYDGCPGDGGTLIAGTTTTWTDVLDDGPQIISASLAPVTLPETVWMTVSFSTSSAGWIVADEAEFGTTADVFALDNPSWYCAYSFGPPAHSGFYATIRCTVSVDCNDNHRSDAGDIAEGISQDCNDNDIPDECDIAAGSPDCDGNGVPDECDPDCNSNGVPDGCDILAGTSEDCDSNGVPDECDPDCNGNGVADGCDIVSGTSDDCNDDDVPDECELAAGTAHDCNTNGVLDICDITAGTSDDCNVNGTPDECELAAGTAFDCNANGVLDECDLTAGTSLDCNANTIPDECDISAGTSLDCNANDIPDACDISSGTSLDCDSNGIPDDCQPDCNSNGVADACDISSGTSVDCNTNGVPDECEPDCNGNGIADECDLTSGTSEDCNDNSVPDECDILAGVSLDENSNGIPDECEFDDCNANDIPDECDIDCTIPGCSAYACGTSSDCNTNGIPDDCDFVFVDCNANGVVDDCDLITGTSLDVNTNGIPDECETDCNANGVPDDYDIATGTSDDCQPNGVPDDCEAVTTTVYYVESSDDLFGVHSDCGAGWYGNGGYIGFRWTDTGNGMAPLLGGHRFPERK